MKVLRAWYERSQGYPLLRRKLEGIDPTATITSEAYRQLIGRRWNAVFLGSEFQTLTSIQREGRDWPGYCEEPGVVEIARTFIQDCSNGTFEEGRVLVAESKSG